MHRILISLWAILFIVSCAQWEQRGTELDFSELTISQALSALENRQLNCRQLIDGYLHRINRYDQPTKLNAIIMLNPKVNERISLLDKEYRETGKLRQLHCMPVILKDNFDTHDMPTSAGSIALKDHVPPDDAYMVKALRRAGAIILAKSNMAEWAFSPYVTISSTYGTTRNPYDLQRVPAGSSGGTAAAIAANFGIIGMGSDTGNSIRGPAAHNALVGMRSTLGATSRDGIIPLLANRDIGGPLTRTVTDNARVFDVIAGYDPADPITKKAKNQLPKSVMGFLQDSHVSGLRLGVLRQMIPDMEIDEDMERLFEQSITDLKKLSISVLDPVEVPDLHKLMKATGFCSRFKYDLQAYLKKSGVKDVSLEKIYQAKKFLASNEAAMKWAIDGKPPMEQDPPCVGIENDPRRKALLQAVVNTMDKHKLDALIYPSWNYPPRKLGDMQSPHGNNSGKIAPHSGQPAISVPMGFTRNGLPGGLQLLGRPFSEALLYKLAYAYEQATRHRKPPKEFP